MLSRTFGAWLQSNSGIRGMPAALDRPLRASAGAPGTGMWGASFQSKSGCIGCLMADPTFVGLVQVRNWKASAAETTAESGEPALADSPTGANLISRPKAVRVAVAAWMVRLYPGSAVRKS